MTAMRPETTPADMLVPFSLRNLVVPVLVTSDGYSVSSVLPDASFEISACPGARMSGLPMPSYHVGPRELKGATRSSPREIVPLVTAAPTVMADGALPGDAMPAYPTTPVTGFRP